MEQGPEARQQRGVPDISLAALGAWQGAGLGAMGAFLDGCSMLVIMAGGQASRNLFAALIVTTLRIAVVGVLPSALLGELLGALVGHGLCRLPVERPTGMPLPWARPSPAPACWCCMGSGWWGDHPCWRYRGQRVSVLFGLSQWHGGATRSARRRRVVPQLDRDERMLPNQAHDASALPRSPSADTGDSA